MKKIGTIILGALLMVGCAGLRERRALRSEAEQTIQSAEFEFKAVSSGEVARYSGKTIQDARRALDRAREEFGHKKYTNATAWARSARDSAAMAVKQTKEAKQKEAEAEALKNKSMKPVKKKPSRR